MKTCITHDYTKQKVQNVKNRYQNSKVFVSHVRRKSSPFWRQPFAGEKCDQGEDGENVAVRRHFAQDAHQPEVLHQLLGIEGLADLVAVHHQHFFDLEYYYVKF